MRLHLWAAASSLAILVCSANAQEFEVASIKHAAPDERRMLTGPGPGGGISVTNMTLKQVIQNAWHIMPFQISGGPVWIDSARYNVLAKPEKKPAPEFTPDESVALPGVPPVAAPADSSKPALFTALQSSSA